MPGWCGRRAWGGGGLSQLQSLPHPRRHWAFLVMQIPGASPCPAAVTFPVFLYRRGGAGGWLRPSRHAALAPPQHFALRFWSAETLNSVLSVAVRLCFANVCCVCSCHGASQSLPPAGQELPVRGAAAASFHPGVSRRLARFSTQQPEPSLGVTNAHAALLPQNLQEAWVVLVRKVEARTPALLRGRSSFGGGEWE